MDDRITTIKEWLGTGSINLFGLPMSGKDTQGIKLAEELSAKFLSSGIIIRTIEAEKKLHYSETGNLIPTNLFFEWVLPYFERKDLYDYPLVLSSIGRWTGEENQVMSIAANAGHPIKAVIVLELSESEAKRRFEAAKALGDRGDRKDDKDLNVFNNRLQEFREKTLPVIQFYNNIGLLIRVNGNQSREEVFKEIIEKLYAKAEQSHT